jgi:hypothetical protein
MDTNLQTIASTLPLIQAELDQKDATIAGLNQQLIAATPMVWENLQYQNWLVASGTAANSGSVGNTATSTQTLPGVACATRGIKPNGSYADKYWYFPIGKQPQIVRFKQEYSILFASEADSAASQAVETDLQQCIGGVVFNFGVQLYFTQNEIRIWNRSAGVWVVVPGRACPRAAAGTWVNIVLECHRDASNVYYDAVTVFGVRTVLNQSFPAPALGLSDMLNVGEQLDGENAPNAYMVSIDLMKLTGWQA